MSLFPNGIADLLPSPQDGQQDDNDSDVVASNGGLGIGLGLGIGIGGTNTNKNSSTSMCTGTRLCVVLAPSTSVGSVTVTGSSSGSDPFMTQRVQVIVWASQTVRKQPHSFKGGENNDNCENNTENENENETSRSRSRSNSNNTPIKTTTAWTYYTFWDHPRQFSHLDTLVQRLAPISVIHVGSTEPLTSTTESNNNNNNNNGNNQRGRVKASSSLSSSSSSSTTGHHPTAQIKRDRMAATAERCMTLLQQHSAEYIQGLWPTPVTVTSAAAAPECLIQWHGTIPALDRSRLDHVLQQLLVTVESPHTNTNTSSNNNSRKGVALPNEYDNAEASSSTAAMSSALNPASLHVAANVQLQDPILARSLVFALQQAGLWQGTSASSSSSSSSCPHGHVLLPGQLHSCLYMDRTAVQALHVWPPTGLGQASYVGGHKHNNSLAGFLGEPLQTAAMGRRLLDAWLQQPLVDLQVLQQRQDAVQVLVERSVARDALRQQGLRLFGEAQANVANLAMLLQQQSAGYNEHDTGADVDVHVEGSPIEQVDANARPAARSGPRSTKRSLQALYQLYLISSVKLPRLNELLLAVVYYQDEDNLEPATSAPATPCSSVLLKQLAQTIQESCVTLQRSVQLCEAVLDLDAAPRDWLVRADFKPELARVKAELDDLDAELQQCHNEMNELWESVTGHANAVRLERNDNNNSNSSGSSDNADIAWQFRLPNTNDSKTLQSDPQLKGACQVHKLLKNGVYFTTKPLRQLAHHKCDLLREYHQHCRDIVAQAMPVAATYQATLEQLAEAVSQLDVLASWAHVAAYSPTPYCRPVLTDSDDDGCGVDLRGARHPCVELQENVEYIPNDIQLRFGESSFLIVTGPNMGGKSTYIRALGAIVVLAQIGAYVPCTSATINLCHHILARVGAGDLQERGISTFMAEMLEAASILRTATKRSLIIIDELGRGTSTFDGYGLARAISEYIVQRIGCMTVFATHFHELTALQDTFPSVQNRHVAAQKGSQGLTFLYQVRPGPCLESFGIQVAEMANVPAVVIQDAKRKARQLENFEYRRTNIQAIRDDDDAIMNDHSNINDDDEKDAAALMDDHTAAEEAAAALDWVNRFRNLPEHLVNSLSSTSSDMSNDEKQQMLLSLLHVE